MGKRTTISVDKATKEDADDLKPTNMSWNAFIRACLKAFEDAKGGTNSDMNSIEDPDVHIPDRVKGDEADAIEYAIRERVHVESVDDDVRVKVEESFADDVANAAAKKMSEELRRHLR